MKDIRKGGMKEGKKLCEWKLRKVGGEEREEGKDGQVEREEIKDLKRQEGKK